MSRKKKRKGFTLVELLVAISIIGIITLIAIPTVNGVIENKNRGIYQKYGETLVSSTKLYADSYDVDLFGMHPSGCMTVDLETLMKKNLIKNVEIKNANCDTDDTYVIVKKVQGKYQYQQQLKCINHKNNVLYEQKITKPICTEESSHTGPEINLEKPKDGWVTTKKAYVSIDIEDTDGLLENNELIYKWATDAAGTNIVYKKKLNFGNDLNDKKVTKRVSRPEADGKYYLIVQPVNVVDVFGNYTTTPEVKGEYKFDSNAPKCDEVVQLKSESTSPRTWTNQDVELEFAFDDDVAGYEWITYKDGSENETSDNPRKEDNSIATKKSLKSAGVRTYKIIVRDQASNKSECNVGADYYIDKTNPTCTITPDDADKWYTKTVELQVKPKDDLSGVAASDLTTSTTATYLNNKVGTQSTDTDGQKWYGYVKDKAGNVGKCSTTVKLDQTKPTCDIVVSEGTTGDNGWYKSDVKLSLTTNDATSGVGKKYDLTKSETESYDGTSTGTQTADTTGKKWYGYVKDKAGNIGKCNKTIKKDSTKPSCTVKAEGTEGLSNWYTSNVALSLTNSDATSGVASNGLTTDSSTTYNSQTTGSQTTDTTGVIWYGYVKDAAGNTKKCEKTIKKDATKPTCEVGVSSGTTGDNGWYTSSVGLSLTPNDATSGVKDGNLTTSTTASYSGTLTGTQSTDTTGKKWYGYVQDNAGNKNSCNKTIKKDTEKPSCTVSSSGTTGTNSWYTGDVSMSLTQSDDTSGVVSKGLTTSTTVGYNGNTTGSQTTDTTGTKWYGYVKDAAGHTETCNKSVKKDATKPGCSISVSSGSGGTDGWYRSNVGLTLSPSDATSGVAGKDLTTSSTASYGGTTTGTQTTDTSGNVWYGYVKDNAGNTKKCEYTVKKDTTAPSCTVKINSGTAGEDDWYRTDIGLELTTSDNASGVSGKTLTTSTTASYGNTTKGTQNTDTSGTKWYGYVQDKAGNTASCNKEVKRDTVAPECKVTVSSGTLGDNNWYTTNVGISLTQSDGRSGVFQKGLSISSDESTNGSTSDTQTANTTRIWYGYVKDKAGNTTKCNKTVKKDAEKPTCSIAISSGTKGNNDYYKSNIGLKMTPSDDVSGIAKKGFSTSSGSTNGYTTGTQSSDTTGTTWYGYVKDDAGNTNSCSKTVYKDTEAPYIVEKVSYDAGKCISFRGSNLQHNTVIHRIKIIFQDDTSGLTDILYKYEYDDSTPDGSYITDDTLYLSRSNTIVLSRNKHNRFKRVRQDYNLTAKEDAWFKFKLVDRAGNSVVTASQKANYDGSASSAHSGDYCRHVFPTPDAYATLRKNYYYGVGNGNAGKCMTDDATYCYLVPDDGK